jgi:hypothetical protein
MTMDDERTPSYAVKWRNYGRLLWCESKEKETTINFGGLVKG